MRKYDISILRALGVFSLDFCREVVRVLSLHFDRGCVAALVPRTHWRNDVRTKRYSFLESDLRRYFYTVLYKVELYQVVCCTLITSVYFVRSIVDIVPREYPC